MKNGMNVLGCGAVTALGHGTKEIFEAVFAKRLSSERSMQRFKPAPYLSQKKMLKAISPRDALGLVAIEDLKQALTTWERHDCTRRGIFVGSPSASTFDHENYMEAQQLAVANESGEVMKRFGAEVMRAQPNTLLQGLPNNVLCYGSLIMDCQGPNNNFTSLDIGGHVALIRGLRSLRSGLTDAIIAGGYCAHSEPVNKTMFDKLGVATTRMADGAAFVALDRSTDNRSVSLLDGLVRHTSQELPIEKRVHAATMRAMIDEILCRNKVDKEQVGLVMLHQFGADVLDHAECDAIEGALSKNAAWATLTSTVGNLVEAGGMLELAVLPKLFQHPDYLEAISMNGRRWDGERPYVVCTRTNFLGDCSAILARVETGA